MLALIDGKKVRAIYHTSSGAPGTPTVLGRYKVYRKDLGTNGLGMVDASYFIRGYAIHGYMSVPAFNASHGCLRVPIPTRAGSQLAELRRRRLGLPVERGADGRVAVAQHRVPV